MWLLMAMMIRRQCPPPVQAMDQIQHKKVIGGLIHSPNATFVVDGLFSI